MNLEIKQIKLYDLLKKNRYKINHELFMQLRQFIKRESGFNNAMAFRDQIQGIFTRMKYNHFKYYKSGRKIKKFKEKLEENSVKIRITNDCIDVAMKESEKSYDEKILHDLQNLLRNLKV